MTRLAYIIPVHNEERILNTICKRLQEELQSREDAEIILVENGSSDQSWILCQGWAPVPQFSAYRETQAGLGFAYRRGIIETLRRWNGREELWLVLSAADLPFGFSDLNQFEGISAKIPQMKLAIGSKAHPRSRIKTNTSRYLAGITFYWLRKLLLRTCIRDSQGTIFLRADLAAQIVSSVKSRDFFFSAELIDCAERKGTRIVELPVWSAGALRPSKVDILEHGSRMLWQTLCLSWRRYFGEK